MQDNLEGGELDPADDVCRRCKKNSPSVLFALIGKRSKEVCGHGSEVRTVHIGQDRKEPVSLRKPKESDRREREF